MSDEKRIPNGFASDPIAERMRRIRFRMTREHTRFRSEIRLIPGKLVSLVAILYVIAQVVGQVVIRFKEGPWPEYSYRVNALGIAGIITGVSIPIACLIFLIGYVYCDARRRNMSASLWTILVVILLPAYLGIGFIIYFLLREPLPYACPHCGETVNARFNFCPTCKFNLRPSCPNCRREVRLGDRFCPHCAAELAGNRASLPQGGAGSKADLEAIG